MNELPRIRDAYAQYLRGEMTFDRLIEISEAHIARWEREHADDPPIEEPLLGLRERTG